MVDRGGVEGGCCCLVKGRGEVEVVRACHTTGRRAEKKAKAAGRIVGKKKEAISKHATLGSL